MRQRWYRRLIDAALPEPDSRVPWRPTGCDVDCLRSEEPPTVSSLLRLIRLAALGMCLAATLCLMAIAPSGGRLARWSARAGSRAGLACVGIALLRPSASTHVIARRPPNGALVVSGHVSWLDILVLQAVYGPMRMLAMNELASWPVLSWLARQAGTIFIDRDRLLTLPGRVAELTAALRAGEMVGAFPEGATTCGRHVLSWRNAVFQAAVDANAEVLVVRLSYRAAGKPTGHVAMLRRESALSSLWRVLKLRGLAVDVHPDWLPRVDPTPTRRELAAAAVALAGPS